MKNRDRNKLRICGGQIVKQLINTVMEIKAETLLSSASSTALSLQGLLEIKDTHRRRVLP